ncbi:MAG: CooT family nickel-binding protein [Anaerolineae bacterium]
MCETSVYAIKGGKEEKILEDVILMQPEEGGILMSTLLGERKLVPGRISRIDFLKHVAYITEEPSEKSG